MEIRIGDEELGSAGVKDVAVIKMDIEGYEKAALRFAQYSHQQPTICRFRTHN